MRKRLIGHSPGEVAATEPDWLDLEHLAQVEINSEDVGYPIESALLPGTGSGWRAAQSGEQTIRLLFDEPLRLKRIQLVFQEVKRSARRSSFYGGHQTAGSRTGRLCASSITSVHQRP
jgi:hypothetical protein